MNTYKVIVCVPCTHNNWQATIEKRLIEAENLNELISKATTTEEHKKGAKIIEVYEHHEDDFHITDVKII